MNRYELSVREIQEKDIEPLSSYWLTADSKYLAAMGAEITKIPPKEYWTEMLTEQISHPYHEKKFYCITWLMDNEAVRHSNINKIQFAKEAYMHLPLWKKDTCMKGCGTAFVKMIFPYFFENFKLNTLYCESYALNPAPNKTLEKAGFEFIKQYRTIPGAINFEQDVNLWQLTRERYLDLKTINL
jgi:RimJ/RimL family protein N-acetyltransferase